MISKRIVTLMMGCSVLVACQQEDFGVNEQEVYTSAYNREFTNTFGNVNPGQTWDLTTRAMTEYKSVAEEDGKYYVTDETLAWFKTNMEDDTDNSGQVKPFALTTTEATTFEVVPIFQGNSSYRWTVEMFVNGKSVWSWEKGKNLEHYSVYSGKWHEAYATMGDATDDAAGVRSTPSIVNVDANSNIYFKISIIDSEGKDKGSHTSLEKSTWIGTLTGVPTPANIPSDYSCMIITCEDQNIVPITNRNNTQQPDFNDAAFMLVGYVPQVVFEDQESTIVTTKRYMMEDMGSIDWDFNDVVVDVTTTETSKKHINTQTNEWVYIEDPTITTTAKIAHLGGTYPIQVVVGETALPLISDPTNHEQTEAELAGNSTTHTVATGGSNTGWEPANEPVTVRGYEASRNNVTLHVYKNFDIHAGVDNSGVWETKFPKRGEVPYIIATNARAEWTAEGVNVNTTSWWDITKESDGAAE